MRYEHTKLPAQGARITVIADGSLAVPVRTLIPLIEATHGTAPGFVGKDRVNPGATLKSCAGFGDAIIQHMAD